ncbi:MAG TPA: hypothetical protein VGH74_12660 [Planctomycetaceae bacterium]
MDGRPLAARECGSCTACCTVLVVAELHKPARWACDHVHCGGCGIYEIRPESCREFNCAWLRGQIPRQIAGEISGHITGHINGDESHRPDRLGVMFDFFYSTAAKRNRLVAFELWKGAFEEAPAAALLNEIAATREIDLSYRDGTWRTIGATGSDDKTV